MNISGNEVILPFLKNDEFVFFYNGHIAKTQKVQHNLETESPEGYGFSINKTKAVFAYKNPETQETSPIMTADWYVIGHYTDENYVDFAWGWAARVEDENPEKEYFPQLDLCQEMRSVFADHEDLHYLANPRLTSEDSDILLVIRAYCSHYMDFEYIADFSNEQEGYTTIFGFKNIKWVERDDLEVVEIEVSDD